LVNIVHYIEISLSIGSKANYTGDGPTARTNSLELNGFVISKFMHRYYIVQVNANVLRNKFPNNAINIGDEVIKINDMYCEHVRNIKKLIETEQVRTIMLKKGFGENRYTVTINETASINGTIDDGKSLLYILH